MKTPRILRLRSLQPKSQPKVKAAPKYPELPTFTRIRAMQSLGMGQQLFTEGREYEVESIIWHHRFDGTIRLRVFAFDNSGRSRTLTEGDWWDSFTIVE